MIQSMTGFGKVTAELPSKKVTIEIKSLNSKQLDLYTRISPVYREKEIEIRNELAQLIVRGKVECNIYIENIGKEIPTQINLPAIESYYKQIKTISETLSLPAPSDWFRILLRMPDVIKNEISEIDESEWLVVKKALREAAQSLIDFRIQEGAMLKQIFEDKITNITSLLAQVDLYEGERIEKIKARITESLNNLTEIQFDRNRLEQEMIYYIEKLDMNEEKTRLTNHLKYFIDTTNDAPGQGKKLGFIIQEIGREINTLGSKSNHADIQKIVVRMKDELEQIKEQILNVL